MQPISQQSSPQGYISQQSQQEQYHHHHSHHPHHHSIYQQQVQQPQPGGQPTVYITPLFPLQGSDGYVAAPPAGYSAPQSGPPHQGPPVIRSMQSTAPPTPPNQDLNKMQQQPSQMYVSTGGQGGNGAGNVRPNQQANIYRSATATTQRGPRHTIMSQQIYQHHQLPVVAMSSQYAHAQFGTPRQPASQIYTSTPPIHFSQTQLPSTPYFYFQHSVMPTSNQRPGVPSAMLPGTGGQALVGPGGGQSQMSMPPSGMLGSNGQGPAATPAGSGRSGTRKKRTHALEIIHPVTRMNILDQLENSKSQGASGTSIQDVDYAEQVAGNDNTIQPNLGTISCQEQLKHAAVTADPSNKAALQGVAFMDMMQHHNISAVSPCQQQVVNPDILAGGNGGHTPIVSAMSDGPSVEIPPKPQNIKQKKNKSIEIVAPPTSSDKTSDKINRTQSTTNISNQQNSNSANSVKTSDEITENKVVRIQTAETETVDQHSVPTATTTIVNDNTNRGEFSSQQQHIQLSKSSISSSGGAQVATSLSIPATTSVHQDDEQSEQKLITQSQSIALQTESSSLSSNLKKDSKSSLPPLPSNVSSSSSSPPLATNPLSQQQPQNLSNALANSTTSNVNTSKAHISPTSSLSSSLSGGGSSTTPIPPTQLVAAANENQNKLAATALSSGSNNIITNSNVSNSQQSSNVVTTAGSGKGGHKSKDKVGAQQHSSNNHHHHHHHHHSSQHQSNHSSQIASISNQDKLLSNLSIANTNQLQSDKMKDEKLLKTSNSNNTTAMGGVISSGTSNTVGAPQPNISSSTLPITTTTNVTAATTNTPSGTTTPAGNALDRQDVTINKVVEKNGNSKNYQQQQQQNISNESSSHQQQQNNETNIMNQIIYNTNNNNNSNNNNNINNNDGGSIDNTADKATTTDQITTQQSLDETDRSTSSNLLTDETRTNYLNNNNIVKDNIKTENDGLPDPCSNDNESNRIEKSIEREPTNHTGLPVSSSSNNELSTDTTVNDANDNVTAPGEDDEGKTTTAVSGALASGTAQAQYNSLITYNEGQWSPTTQSGNRTYSKDQLLTLRDAPASKAKPEVNSQAAVFLLESTLTPQPSLMPAFVRNQGKRNQSMGSSGMGSGGGMSNSSGGNVKQSSMSGASKNSTKGNKPGMIHVSLSLREDVKLNETENAWRPTRLQGDETVPTETRAKEEIFRRVRGILNKLTPDNFNSLVEQIMALQIDTPEKVNGVMMLVFEKAIDEPNFSVSYARLCQRLADNRIQSEVKNKDGKITTNEKSNVVQFKIALIDKTQHEFSDNVLERKAKEQRLRPIMEKIKECADREKKLELQASLEEEERKIRRRSGGTVRFIGELFKISMLTGNIINTCINKLLDHSSEDKLECLCKLLTTVGQQFEQSHSNQGNRFNLDEIIKKMQSIVDKKTDSKISSRVRFMLQDVIDLRKNKWASKRNELNPKTMEQIQKEAESEQISNQFMNSSYVSSKKDDRRFNSGGGNSGSGNNSGGGGGGVGGGGVGGGSGRDFYNKNNNRQQNQWNDDSGFTTPKGEDAWYTQPSKSNRVVDPNKLMSTPDYENAKPVLGASSQFQWVRGNDSSKSNTTMTSNSFAALSVLDTNRLSSERGAQRNRGSFNKGSMERDRYARHSRTGSAHGSRENSSSRNTSNRNTSNWSTNHSYGGSNSPSNQRSNKSVSGPQPSPLSLSSASGSTASMSSSNSTNSVSNSVSMTTTQTIPTTPNFAEMSDDDIESLKKVIIKMVSPLSDSTPEECIQMLEKYQKNYRWAIIYTILSDYLHLHQTKPAHRERAAETIIMFYNKKLLPSDDIRYGYKKFFEIVEDILIDVPAAWKYVIEFTGPLLHKKIIQLKDVWIEKSTPCDSGKKFLKQLITYSCQEFGPSYTHELWKTSGFKWTSFMAIQDVDNFIHDNHFGFVESKDVPPPITEAVPNMSRINSRIKYLLKSGANMDSITDYISGNVQTINKDFIRGLTTTIIAHSTNLVNKNHRLDKNELQKVGINLLQRYIDSKEDRELECLYAIQEFINELEHPSGLLYEIFLEFYDSDVIPGDTFIKWRDSKDEPSGKGVAVKSLTSFFDNLLNDTSDENN